MQSRILMLKHWTDRARPDHEQSIRNPGSGRLAKRSRSKNHPALTVAPNGKTVLEEATGSDQLHLQQHLIGQVRDTLWSPGSLSEEEKSARIGSAISLLQGIKPADETESMLAVQMVATHNAATDCLRRAMIEGQSFEGREQNLKHAGKLLSIYSRQIEVLDKHRGKGQQKVTVEHVHVAAGGQAMVGQFDSGKTAGARRTGAKPEIKAIPDDPGEILDMDLAVKKSEPSRKS